MTGVLFDGGMRRTPTGRLGHLWRLGAPRALPGYAAALCGKSLDYHPDELLADEKISRACPDCESVAARLDRETGQVPCRPDCDLCGRPLRGWATVPPDDPAADCGGTCQACMNRAEAGL